MFQQARSKCIIILRLVLLFHYLWQKRRIYLNLHKALVAYRSVGILSLLCYVVYFVKFITSLFISRNSSLSACSMYQVSQRVVSCSSFIKSYLKLDILWHNLVLSVGRLCFMESRYVNQRESHGVMYYYYHLLHCTKVSGFVQR